MSNPKQTLWNHALNEVLHWMGLEGERNQHARWTADEAVAVLAGELKIPCSPGHARNCLHHILKPPPGSINRERKPALLLPQEEDVLRALHRLVKARGV